MMINPVYRAQVDLLLRVLPFVAQEQVFALKGGTAINLFIRNLPRMSVDIDLSYLPFDDRNTALANIESALRRIKKRIEESKLGIRVTSIPIAGNDAKLSCQLDQNKIIIEANTTIRGHLFEPRVMSVVDKVQAEFEWFAGVSGSTPRRPCCGQRLCECGGAHRRGRESRHQGWRGNSRA